MAANPSPPPTPVKPEIGKYKFRANHEVTYCIMYIPDGTYTDGNPKVKCTKEHTFSFKEGDVINSTESHFNPGSNVWNWDHDITINGNHFSIPSGILEKVDDSTAVTVYTETDLPRVESTPVMNELPDAKMNPDVKNLIIVIVVVLVVVGLLKLFKII